MKRLPYDVALLIGRVAIGVIFVMEGWKKCVGGIDATAKGFVDWGILVPKVWAGFSIVAELGGGTLLILGFLTYPAGIAAFVLMASAFFYVHVRHGAPLDSGFELVLALGAAALLVAVIGPGRLSLEYVLLRRREVAAALH